MARVSNPRSAVAHAAHRTRVILRRKRCRVLAFAAGLAAAGMMSIISSLLVSRPQHTSILTGNMLMQELLHPDAHEATFHDLMGLSRAVFWKLLVELQHYGGLRNTRHITAVEKLGMFLYQLRTGCHNRVLKHRFQHSGSTISE